MLFHLKLFWYRLSNKKKHIYRTPYACNEWIFDGIYRVEKRKSPPLTNFWNKYIKDKHYQKSLNSVYDLL